jgi:hypothetical protein
MLFIHSTVWEMNSEQTLAIMAACEELREEGELCNNPWKSHAATTLSLIQARLRDNNTAVLCVLAEVWKLATKQPELGETYESYAFLRALLARPELGLINWAEKSNPLPIYPMDD